MGALSTGIEWTAETWNPLAAFDRETGERGWFCTKVSPGCANCYAEALNKRLGTGHAYAVPNLEEIEFRLVNLDRPLKWQASGKHCRVFVNSMTDLFHEEVSWDTIGAVFAVMACAPDLTFQILTKRPERMAELRRLGGPGAARYWMSDALTRVPYDFDAALQIPLLWPLPNVWLGTSVEDQERANERIPPLMQTPAAVRFLSCEPLLDALNLRPFLNIKRDGLGWIIVGGESGPQARPMEMDWALWIVEQCQRAGVSVFVKQLGSVWAGSGRKKGGDPEAWPEGLRVREFPDEAPIRSSEEQGELAL